MITKKQLEDYLAPDNIEIERRKWLSSMNRAEREVRREEDGLEYILVSTQDLETRLISQTKVYLPITIQHNNGKNN